MQIVDWYQRYINFNKTNQDIERHAIWSKFMYTLIVLYSEMENKNNMDFT